MSTLSPTASAVSTLIQTALAPIFLLTAVGATLTVIDNRLNRIVDRVRELEPRLLNEQHHEAEILAEIDHFIARARAIARAVALCATTALAVAVVVIVIFIDLQTPADLSLASELVFVFAVCLYVLAVVIYLGDVWQVEVGLNFLRNRVRARRSG